jgi:hypothetical protein
VIPGNAKCHQCFKGKKGCKFPVEEEEGLEDEEEVEEASAMSKLPVASLKKLISSPLHSLHKRKKTDLSPESQKEKAATPSIAMHARRKSPSLEVLEFRLQVSIPPSSVLSSRSQGLSMPPPSMISSRSQVLPFSSSCLFFLFKDYCMRLLQTALYKFKEDLNTAQDRFASQESLYLDQIAELEKKVGKGSSSCCK